MVREKIGVRLDVKNITIIVIVKIHDYQSVIKNEDVKDVFDNLIRKNVTTHPYVNYIEPTEGINGEP